MWSMLFAELVDPMPDIYLYLHPYTFITLLAGLPGVAQAFTMFNVKILYVCPPSPRCTPKIFNPSMTSPG